MRPDKFHAVTYADILRDLEPLNGSRAPTDRITYDGLLRHRSTPSAAEAQGKPAALSAQCRTTGTRDGL
ncbi:MAG: hypothetical protein WB777_25465, partial [Mycobacterium sp.]